MSYDACVCAYVIAICWRSETRTYSKKNLKSHTHTHTLEKRTFFGFQIVWNFMGIYRCLRLQHKCVNSTIIYCKQIDFGRIHMRQKSTWIRFKYKCFSIAKLSPNWISISVTKFIYFNFKSGFNWKRPKRIHYASFFSRERALMARDKIFVIDSFRKGKMQKESTK